MPARRSVHHSHQHAVSMATDNAHSTGPPLQKRSPRTSRATSLRATLLGTTPVSRNRVYDPPWTGDRVARNSPFSIAHLLTEVCTDGLRPGSLIPHASGLDPSPLPPLPLRVPVILAPLHGRPVPPPGRPCRPPSPLSAARSAAVRVPPVAAPVDQELVAAGAAPDDQKLQSPSAGRKTGPRGSLR
jgi:hypothetical protein